MERSRLTVVHAASKLLQAHDLPLAVKIMDAIGLRWVA